MTDGSPPSERSALELALAEAREKLRFQAQLLDSVGQSIIATDVTGNITYVNPAAESLFLWTSAEVLGRKIGEVTKTSVTRDQAVEIITRLSRGETWSGEFLFTRKDGTQFVGEVVNWPIRNSDGKLIGVCGTALDLTERRALETQLRQAQKLEVIGRLAGGIAHDFNNILQAMLLNIQLLQLDSDRRTEDQESLDELKALTERAATVTSRLLMFARRQAVQLQRIELNSGLLRTVGLLRHLLGERITVRLEAAPQPLWIDVDSGMLDQVIMNLCLNARDAMPNGGELVLGTEDVAVDEELARKHTDARLGRYACLSVRDTGERHESRADRAHLRAVLHHQGDRQGNRARACCGVRNRSSASWFCQHRQHPRNRNHLLCLSAAVNALRTWRKARRRGLRWQRPGTYPDGGRG